MNKQQAMFEQLADVLCSSIDDSVDQEMVLQRLRKLSQQQVNLLITGATGSGKSSTINALFNTSDAKVGTGVDPQTMHIKCYQLGNLVLWDSPGLGDGPAQDAAHTQAIVSKLQECDKRGAPLIDLVLVVVDGSSRDLGTTYGLINEVIIPALGSDAEQRLLIGINQADLAMKGKHWDGERNQPEGPLLQYLEEKANSVRRRIFEATQVVVEPICYSAGYTDGNSVQRPWNLTKLLCWLVERIPASKRLAVLPELNDDEAQWRDTDGQEDYQQRTRRSWQETTQHVIRQALEGARQGAVIGSAIPVIGPKVGAIIGGVCGGVSGLLGALW